MKGKRERVILGSLMVIVFGMALVLAGVALADANNPDPKTSGDHITYIFCHRTGSLSNPYIVIGTDDAAWAEAHITGVDPAHPPQNGNDDVLLDHGVGLNQKDYSTDLCVNGPPPPPPPPPGPPPPPPAP